MAPAPHDAWFDSHTVLLADPLILESARFAQARIPWMIPDLEAQEHARARLEFLIERIPKKHGDILVEVGISCLTQVELGVKYGLCHEAISHRWIVARDAARLVGWFGSSWPHPGDVFGLVRDLEVPVDHWHPDGYETPAMAWTIQEYLRTWSMQEMVGQNGVPILTNTAHFRIHKFMDRWGHTPLGRIVRAVNNWSPASQEWEIGLWEELVER